MSARTDVLRMRCCGAAAHISCAMQVVTRRKMQLTCCACLRPICEEDKQWIMRKLSPITANMAVGIDRQHNMRWDTLMSVDDYIEAIVTMLEDADEMKNTYFLYTSDQ